MTKEFDGSDSPKVPFYRAVAIFAIIHVKIKDRLYNPCSTIILLVLKNKQGIFTYLSKSKH